MLPTLLSAMQARRNLSSDKADVVILFVGPADDTTGLFDALCRSYDIAFQRVAPGEIDDLPIQFARHHLDRLLDPRFRHVVHADGDTQICGSLDPLVDLPLPPNQFLAAPDPMAVMIREPGRTWTARRAYLASIGIPEGRVDRYFNTGIFRGHRSDLREIGRECIRLCRENGARFVFSEQDAFNIAFGRQAALISFKWNFPAFLMNYGYEAAIGPRMTHYMSNPRPWQGAFLPWGEPAHRAYLSLIEAHPDLGRFLQPHRGVTALRYRAQQRYKRAAERRAWNNPKARDRIARFEREATV